MHNLVQHSVKYLRRRTRKFLNFVERTMRHTRWNIKEYKANKTWLSPADVKEYRKKIKIYDTFNFFNELDLLEIRLAILDPYVDYFVLVEATQTFSGTEKPLHYLANKERYSKWNHKIIHVIVDDAPTDKEELRMRLQKKPNMNPVELEIIQNSLSSANTGTDEKITHWFREFYIKESIKRGLVGVNDTDICYISDLDEIWNPDLLIDYSKEDIFKLRQLGYMYYLNNRSDEEDWMGWTGTVVTQYKNIRNSSVNLIRTHSRMKDTFIFLRNGGWHFGFQGAVEGAKRKIKEANHIWYNPAETLPNLEKRVTKNQDYRGRDIRLWKSEKGLPQYLLENKEKYTKFFKHD